ncbi:regulator of G-protein signaling 9-binding protein [Osmerus eperlanus]|uniref:regulator of G-protein signaling 9-binding protein n=1 Tax=Osmerus eperlanus TaxID=29151 RepID=UPI002E147A57
MPLLNNKVGDDGTARTPDTLEEGKALVESLIKVVACYRHLASCVGGSTDELKLREELRQTREKAQNLSVANRQHLTARLRDKSLTPEERMEMELLWVAFSSSLELLYADMCKVCNMGNIFPLSKSNALVQTGIQGETAGVAARALSLPDLTDSKVPENVEEVEQSQLEEEISRVDLMIEDMELKVNVLRWTVEPRGPKYTDPVSSDSASLTMFSVDEEDPGHQRLCQPSQIFILLLLCGVAVVAAVLSVCVVYFS